MSERDFDPFSQFSQGKAEPPSSSSRDECAAESKRPKLVWVITIFYVCSAAFLLISFAAIRQDKVRLPPEEAAYMAQFGAFDFLWSLLTGSISLYAAICLFQLRAIAARLFLILLIIGLVNGLWYAFTTDWISYLFEHPPTLIGTVIGLALSFGVWYYADRLKRRGVLT